MANSLAESARISLGDARIAHLATLADLVRERADAERFYAGLVDVCLKATNAIAACVWRLEPGQALSVVAEGTVPVVSVFAADTDRERRHTVELRNAIQSAGATLLIDDADVTQRQLMVMPIELSHQNSIGAIELVMPPQRDPKPDIAFLQTTAEIATEYARSSSVQQPVAVPGTMNAESVWQQLDAFALSLHENPTLEAVAFTIVNDGRALVGCDRLALATRRGRRFSIQTVSGQAQVNARADAIGAMAALSTRAGLLGKALTYPAALGVDGDQQFDSLTADYLAQSAATAIRTEPLLTADGECVGVLLAEWFGEPTSQALVEAIARHAAVAVRNATSPASAFPVFSRLFTASKVTLGLVSGGIIAALCVIPAPLAIEASGAMQPANRRNVFAPRDAVVHDVLVSDGAKVGAGAPLIELRDSDLEYELSRVTGDILTTTQRIESLDASVVLSSDDGDDRAAAESEELRQHLDSLQKRSAILQQANDDLVLLSPMAGQLMTWDPQQMLDSRPVRRGQVLLTVANPEGDWILELAVPDEEFAHIAKARSDSGEPLSVTFRTSTEPGKVWKATLTNVATTTETDDVLGPVVRLTAAIDRSEIADLRPGIGVVARIQCGHRALGYVWMRDLIDSVRGRIAMW